MLGLASTREASAADAIDGVVPGLIAEPDTGEGLAAALAWASSEHRATVIRGGGTKIGWGRVPMRVDLLLGTSRLDSVLLHRHADLTATAGAGVTLAAFNQTLSAHGQWLPVDSAFDLTTIGGMLATNDSGPLRHRYGTPRDLLIGITLALANGRIVKAGGNVVKNVAGYDLGKFVTGSHGSVAAIVDATFKLLPLPKSSATLTVVYANPESLARDVAAITASQIELAAFDVRASERTGLELLLRFASSPAATEAQMAEARFLLSGEISIMSGERESALWAGQQRVPWMGVGTVVRMSWLPSKILDVLFLVRRVHREAGGLVTFVGRAAGAGFLRLEGDHRGHAAVVEQLRGCSDVGNVVVLRASREVKQSVDVWGPPTDSMKVSRTLKQMFDPAGILNAGRGPI